MIRNWKDEFFLSILERGKSYYEEGRVSCLRQIDNTYLATVCGSSDYEVEITVSDNYVKKMDCSCPYSRRGYCKHMAAVLFALDDERVSVEKRPSVNRVQLVKRVPVDIPWLKAVDNLPEAVIRKELLKLADRDACLKERLAVLFLGKLPENQLQDWRACLQETAVGYADYRGRIDEDDTWDFLNYLEYFLDMKLSLLCEVGAIEDAFGLIWIVTETALEWELDDGDEELPCLVEKCKNAVHKLLPLVSKELCDKMIQWYSANRNENLPGGVEYMDDVFREVTELLQTNETE